MPSNNWLREKYPDDPEGYEKLVAKITSGNLKGEMVGIEVYT